MSKQSLGKIGEDIAAQFLQSKGYDLIEKNFRLREGEIDLVCKKDTMLIFVEVKTRTSRRFGQPEEAVDPTKLNKLESLAQLYCQYVNHQGAWRIEVVSIIINHQKRSIGIKHLTEL